MRGHVGRTRFDHILGLCQPDLLASYAKCIAELQPPIIGSPLARLVEQLSELPALVTSFG
jgi:hypothetical protein